MWRKNTHIPTATTTTATIIQTTIYRHPSPSQQHLAKDSMGPPKETQNPNHNHSHSQSHQYQIHHLVESRTKYESGCTDLLQFLLIDRPLVTYFYLFI